MAVSANRLELLQIADAVAREKSIDRMIVIQSMQDAIEKAAKTRYGAETDVRAEINPRTGELRLWRLLEVSENVEEPARQIESFLKRELLARIFRPVAHAFQRGEDLVNAGPLDAAGDGHGGADGRNHDAVPVAKG